MLGNDFAGVLAFVLFIVFLLGALFASIIWWAVS